MPSTSTPPHSPYSSPKEPETPSTKTSQGSTPSSSQDIAVGVTYALPHDSQNDIFGKANSAFLISNSVHSAGINNYYIIIFLSWLISFISPSFFFPSRICWQFSFCCSVSFRCCFYKFFPNYWRKEVIEFWVFWVCSIFSSFTSRGLTLIVIIPNLVHLCFL